MRGSSASADLGEARVVINHRWLPVAGPWTRPVVTPPDYSVCCCCCYHISHLITGAQEVNIISCASHHLNLTSPRLTSQLTPCCPHPDHPQLSSSAMIQNQGRQVRHFKKELQKIWQLCKIGTVLNFSQNLRIALNVRQCQIISSYLRPRPVRSQQMYLLNTKYQDKCRTPEKSGF